MWPNPQFAAVFLRIWSHLLNIFLMENFIFVQCPSIVSNQASAGIVILLAGPLSIGLVLYVFNFFLELMHAPGEFFLQYLQAQSGWKILLRLLYHALLFWVLLDYEWCQPIYFWYNINTGSHVILFKLFFTVTFFTIFFFNSFSVKLLFSYFFAIFFKIS